MKGLVAEGLDREVAEGLVEGVKETLDQAVEEYKRTPEGRRTVSHAYAKSLWSGLGYGILGAVFVVVGIGIEAEKMAILGGIAVLLSIYQVLRGLVGWLGNR